MKHINMLILTAMVVVGCSFDTKVIDILRGSDGKDGADGKDGLNGSSTSCSVSEAEGGYLLSCGDGSSFLVRNGIDGLDGLDGQDGEDGADGEDGEDGQDGSNGSSAVTVTMYTSSSCTSLGSGYYGKSNSNTYSIYDDNDCHSSDKLIDLNDANSSYWLGSKLGVFASPNDLRVLTFN